MALTVTKKLETVMGNKRILGLDVQGDGTTTTLNTGLTSINFAIYDQGEDTNRSNISWDLGVITFNPAITDSAKIRLLVIGY